MDSIMEHNKALQQNGFFSEADLDANRHSRLSESQLKQFEEQRDFMRRGAGKYERGTPMVVSIFAVGMVLFAAVLDYAGAFAFLRGMLGDLFLPVMLTVLALALFYLLVVIPRQYRASVELYKTLGTPLPEVPPGALQVIEARAEVYSSQSGINRQGRQSSKVSHVLQMDGIRFQIPGSLRRVIQPKRLYRVYAVNDQGAWVLLSMETVEEVKSFDGSNLQGQFE